MPGNVAIRFSTENYETVKKALEGLGPLGQKAMQQLDAASQQPNRGLNFLSSIMENLKSQATGLAFSIGPVGTAMTTLGPAGLAVAAALGVVISAFTTASERAEAFAAWAKEVRQSAETAGVSIQQLSTLRFFGNEVGMDSDQTTRFVERLTLSIEELRKGGGALFDVLARIDTGLVRQVASARNNAQAIDILSGAYSRLENQGQRNQLAAAIGGRGNLAGGRLLGSVAEAGGLQAAADAGKQIDTELIERLARTRQEIEDIKKATDKVYGNMFAEETLNQQKRSAEFWLSIAQAVERIAKARSNAPAGGVGGPDDWMLPPGTTTPGVSSPATTPPESLIGPFTTTVSPASGGNTPWATELELRRRWMSVIGEAATPTDQLKLRILELNAAQEAGRINAEQHGRALNAFHLAQDRALASVRTSIGLMSEQEILTARLRDLEDLRAKGFIKDANEMAAAQRIATKEARASYEQQLVRASDTPALTRLSLDADNLAKNLDQGLAGALQRSTDLMMEMLKGTKSLSQGFNELTQSILDSITKALLMKAIVAPVSSAASAGLSGLVNAGLGGLFGGDGGWGAGTTVTANALGNVYSGGRIIPFAQGGILAGPTLFPMFGGNMGLAGEAGDEAFMPLGRMNNGKLGVHASGGAPQITVLHQVINNHPTAKVTQRDESDGRGGRKSVTVIDEMVASAAGRPGSQTSRALQSAGALTRL